MNYLQLCQRTVRESGTISGDATPSTTVAQSGRLLKVVDWVAEAWKQIQNLHDDWLWMRAEFSGPATIGTPRYTASSWSLTRFSRWILDDCSVTIYKTSLGVSDEGALRFIDWQTWRAKYGRGTQTNNRPTEYTISPMGEFCLGPLPDDAYTVRGEYQKSAQALAINADVPELPDDSLHTVIVWKALMLLGDFDEGAWPVARATVKCSDDLRSMQKYRPVITIGAGASVA